MNSQITDIIPVIKLSSRIDKVQEYYFSRKLKQISAMRQSGLDVINLGIGSPDLPPSANVIDTLYSNACNPSHHGYQSYTGIPALKKAFAEWYKKYFGVYLDPSDEILPLAGSKEGIVHISMAFLDDGDQALVPDPGYPAYSAATKLAGGIPRFYDLTEENGWFPDIDKLQYEGVGKVKIMWTNYPHMPTGKKASPVLFRRLVSFARKNNILLCNDNPYSFILNSDHLSIFSVEGSRDIAIELNSLSKSHNMAGWRVGMMAGNSGFIEAALRVKSNIDSGMFQPVQAAAVEALGAPDEWYSRINDVYAVRRKIAGEIMSLLSCSYDVDQCGLFLWGKIPEKYADSEIFADKILDESLVFITPGLVFGTNGKRYIRISLCAPEEVLQEAAKRIKLFSGIK